jgi:Ssp1 endopeptidase immunity protein Rap1a
MRPRRHQNEKAFLAAAALIALSGSALSGTTTGLSLIKYCTGESLPFCRGYLLGVADEASLCGMNAAVKLGTINVEQLRAIMINYLKRNPQKWNQSGSSLVTAAFEEAWPCNAPQVDYRPVR